MPLLAFDMALADAIVFAFTPLPPLLRFSLLR